MGSGALGIEIGWVPHKLVFAARGSGPFQLAYGSSRAKPAALAVESLIPGYQTEAQLKVAPAKLGDQVTLAGVSRLGATRDYKTMALRGSLILGVTVEWRCVCRARWPNPRRNRRRRTIRISWSAVVCDALLEPD